ncbi:MAG: ATP-binding cassette domain-containing protein [Promethearchaeota archaeon]
MIQVHDLKKYFKENKAVDGISLNIETGELISILGPNGGNAFINGFDIKTGKEEIVKCIGVCPQDIVIYDFLTAEENMEFVAKMHGLTNNKSKETTRIILKRFGIGNRKKKPKEFSGGMKRRLNLAMALVSNPKILFLDEPTVGLDPQARRVIWDYLLELKNKNTTIILTTHNMVEAEFLSDRIAIIDRGKIIAQGTLNELKRDLGSENILEVSLFDQEDLDAVKRSLNRISFVNKINETKGRTTLVVSFQGNIKDQGQILQQEINKVVKGIENIQFRQNSLEDIFLNLTGRRLRD